MFIPSELAWAVSVAPGGLSSSEVEEEDEVTREWVSLFLLRFEPVQLSKYLQNTNYLIRKCEDQPDFALCSRNSPDDVVHTVDLLIGGNVGMFPVSFMIFDLRVWVGRWHTCLANTKESQSQYYNPFLMLKVWCGVTCRRFSQKRDFVTWPHINLLAPAFYSAHIWTDLLQSHLQSYTNNVE